jgi:hypothetical protein
VGEGEIMRINDGSICSDCDFFEHECLEGNYGCLEYCKSKEKATADNFFKKEGAITECKGFVENK